MLKKFMLCIALMSVVFLGAGTALADTSVAWIDPPNGSEYLAGTIVNPTGQASSSGTVGGSGLDLALVLDSSGSMGFTYYAGKSLQQWQKEAAIALVNALPQGTTSVTVIEFDSDANTLRQLTALSSDKNLIIAAINSVDAYGTTNIGSGIALAAAELTSIRHTDGRSQMMVVMSDGVNNVGGSPETYAVTAMAQGIDAIHTVGLPGHSVLQMRDIADGPNDYYGDSDDYGVYTSVTDLSQIIGIFDGTEGNLVGLDHVDIQLPDGTWIYDIATDGIGNFILPDWVMALGINTFTATAYGTDGSVASADLTLNGTAPVPEPATMLLLGTGLVGLVDFGRKKFF